MSEKKEGERTVYSVGSVDIEPDSPVEADVIGSFANRRDAVKECVAYIVERCALRPDIRYALMHDLEHPDFLEQVSKRTGIGSKELLEIFKYDLADEWSMPVSVESAIEALLVFAVYIEGGYDIETDERSDVGAASYKFFVMENQLKTGG